MKLIKEYIDTSEKNMTVYLIHPQVCKTERLI